MATVKPMPPGSDQFVEAFAKGLAVIRAFGPGHDRLTLSEVAGRAGVTPAGARRLLHTLVTLGYVRHEGRQFSLLPAVLELGYAYLGSLSLRELAEPLLEGFVRDTGEVVTVSVLDRTDIVFIARAETRSPYSRRLVAGERLPAHATSMGQVLLAGLADAALDDYLAQGPFEAFTRHTLVRPAALRKAIGQVRSAGHALASEQLELGLCGLAVAVKDRSGQTVAALATSLSLGRHAPGSIEKAFLPRLRALASEIGRGLGA